MNRFVLTSLLVLISLTAAYCQEWGGEIESVEIEIVKERQITLPRASRPFEKIPPRASEPIEPRLTYDFQPMRFEARNINPVLRPLRLKAEELTRLYGRTLSAGMGNFTSPYVEAAISTKREKNRQLAARFFHRSFGSGPVGGSTSANGLTEFSALAKSMGKKLSGGGEINYSYTNLNFYGYPDLNQVSKALLPQHFNRFKLRGFVENARVGDVNFEASASFGYLIDNLNAAESEVAAEMKTDYRLKNRGLLLTTTDYALIARRDERVDARPRHLFRIRPIYQFIPLANLTAQVGAQVSFENDTLGGKRNFHLHPHLTASYELSKTVAAFFRLTGGIDRVSLHTLTAENPWLAPDVPIVHTNRKMEAGGGLKGQSSRGISWTAGAFSTALEHQYFFVNDPSGAKFDLRYPSAVVWRTNPFAEIGFTKDVRSMFKIRFDYFTYTSSAPGFIPWHLPQYRGEVLANIYLYKKLLLESSSFVLGGIRALDPKFARSVALPVAVDLNLKLSYLLSDRFTLFVRGENLLNNSYRLYLNYPVRGLQVLGGATCNF